MNPTGTKLTVVEKVAYGIGHMLNDLCATMWFTYLLVYLQYVLQVRRRTAGLMLMLGQVVDALATPVIGYFSDKGCKGTSYGKRKIWHAIGSLSIVVSFPFIFIVCQPCASNYELYIALICIMICLFQTGWAANQVSHLALIPDIAHSEEESDELNIIRYFFDVAADTLVYCVAWFIFKNNSNTAINESDDYNFMILAVTVLSTGVVTTLIFHIVIKEPTSRTPERTIPVRQNGDAPPNPEEAKGAKPKKRIQSSVKSIREENADIRMTDMIPDDDSTSNNSSTAENEAVLNWRLETPDHDSDEHPEGLGGSGSSDLVLSIEERLLEEGRVTMAWNDWLLEPQFYQIGFLYAMSRLVANISLIYMPIFLQETGRPSETLALVPLTLSLAGVVATVFVKTSRKCIRKKISVILACLVGLVGCGAMALGGHVTTAPQSLLISWGPPDSSPALNPFIPDWLIYCIASLLGISGSMLMILSLALAADMIGKCTESSAFVYGTMGLFDKLLNGLLVVVIQEIAKVMCEAGQSCGWYFQQVVSVGVSITLLVSGGLGIGLFCERLGTTRKMRRELEGRGLFISSSSSSAMVSSDSSELLVPTGLSTQHGYGSTKEPGA